MGSPWSYKLRGNRIIARLFGRLPLRHIHLNDVQYLRLASRDEVSPSYLMLNWMSFLPHCHLMCPVYVLKTRKGRRCFLKLKGGAHFRLRQAIARYPKHPERIESLAA
jgi:hypothetical protein